jgi:hypothetical protein
MDSSEGEKNRLMQLHIAEYAALTTRVTYWVYLQYATYAMAAALFGFLATSWADSNHKRDLAWMSVLALLFIGWALYHSTYELFTEVVYVETHLIPIIKKQALVPHKDFWNFETFMKGLRQSRAKRFEWQYSFPVACFLTGIGLLWLLVRTLLDGHSRDRGIQSLPNAPFAEPVFQGSRLGLEESDRC